MSVKSEIGKILTAGATKAMKNMISLPAVNWEYSLVNKTNNLVASGLYKALQTPAYIKNEAVEAIYEARKNKNGEDISYNNTSPYSLNKMLQESQIQSHTPLYQPRYNPNNSNIAEQMAQLENISRANRNLHKFKS